MTSNADHADNTAGGNRILGSLRAADGKGVVRMEDRFDAAIDALWATLTDPRRLVHWLGEVEGELRLGGEYRFHFFSSGSEGSGRVEACEPPRRLLVVLKDDDAPSNEAIEAVLTAEGEHTLLVVEERGMPLDQLAAYGAGIQIHLEDLAAFLAGRARCDAEARWRELLPAYETLAASVE